MASDARATASAVACGRVGYVASFDARLDAPRALEPRARGLDTPAPVRRAHSPTARCLRATTRETLAARAEEDESDGFPRGNALAVREDASTRNVVSSLAPGHRKLASVREFLTTRHDLYSAKGLVARAARRAGGGEDAAWAASYGGGRPRPASSAVKTTPAVSPGAATPAKSACPPCEAAAPAACGYSFLTVLVAFAVGAFLGGRKDRGHYRTY